jgi:hypothetical protein
MAVATSAPTAAPAMKIRQNKNIKRQRAKR